MSAAAALNKGGVVIAGVEQRDTRDMLVGATVPLGAGRLMASIIRKDDRSGRGLDAHQWGVGYVYSLSKRTALYTAYGTVSNSVKAGTAGFYTVGNASEAGGGDSAFNLGIRHSF